MSQPKSENITWHLGTVTREKRAAKLGHTAGLVWFTGLSGSGKSTIARRVEALLVERGVHAYVLDGDNVRFGLNKNLGFSPDDRTENIRRIGEVAKLMVDSGALVLTAFISPYKVDRDAARATQARPEDFIEVHVNTPLEVCESRDPKGLYKKARSGEIPSFTGISAPYEAPESPELTLSTAEQTLDETAETVLLYLVARGLISG